MPKCRKPNAVRLTNRTFEIRTCLTTEQFSKTFGFRTSTVTKYVMCRHYKQLSCNNFNVQMVLLCLESWTSQWYHLVRGVGYDELRQFCWPVEQASNYMNTLNTPSVSIPYLNGNNIAVVSNQLWITLLLSNDLYIWKQKIAIIYSGCPKTGRPVWQTGQIYVRISNRPDFRRPGCSRSSGFQVDSIARTSEIRT